LINSDVCVGTLYGPLVAQVMFKHLKYVGILHPGSYFVFPIPNGLHTCLGLFSCIYAFRGCTVA